MSWTELSLFNSCHLIFVCEIFRPWTLGQIHAWNNFTGLIFSVSVKQSMFVAWYRWLIIILNTKTSFLKPDLRKDVKINLLSILNKQGIPLPVKIYSSDLQAFNRKVPYRYRNAHYIERGPTLTTKLCK